MRNRSMNQDDMESRPERPAPERQVPREREAQPAPERIRVQPIQYRFIKRMEERGITSEIRQSTLAMAAKIRHLPLTPKRVMNDWVEFTRGANDDYKNNRGSNEQRNKTHEAYAVFFSVVERHGPFTDKDALKDAVARFDPNMKVDQSRAVEVRAAPPREEQRPAAPSQRTLPLPEARARDRDRDSLDPRIDKALASLRSLPVENRELVLMTAGDLLADGRHTRATARAALPKALDVMKRDPTKENAVHALTLLAASRVKDHDTNLRELRGADAEWQGRVKAEARHLMEKYEPGQYGVQDAARHQAYVAVEEVLYPGEKALLRSHAMASVRDDLETYAGQKRVDWEHIASDLASDMG